MLAKMSPIRSIFGQYFGKSKEIILTKGLWSFFGKAISKCTELAYTTNVAYWFCRDLSDPIQHVPERTGFHVEVSTDERIVNWLKRHHKAFGWLYIPEEITAKEAYGHHYLTAVHKGEIIGCIKIGVNGIYVLDFDRILRIPTRTAMIYDTFVLPEYRRKGVCSCLIDESLKLLDSEGYRSVWCHVPPWNTPSIKAYSRAGFKRMARIRFVRILAFGFCSRSVSKMIAM